MDIGTGSYQKVVDLLDAGVYFVDLKRRITYWNKAAETITGFSAGEVVGRACSDNILTHVNSSGENLCMGSCPLERCMNDSLIREDELYLHHKEGHRVPVRMKSCPLADSRGAVIGGVEIFTDLSNKKADEIKVKELEKLAMLDRLTQIANRHYLERELEGRMDEKKRYGVPFGVLFMDVDHFKSFNDTYGHDAGDRVLKFIARGLSANARPFDLFGRWGGEEFLGVIRNISLSKLDSLGNRMRLLVEKSFLPHDSEILRVTISVGGTVAGDSDSVESILKRADALLYQCKASGRNCVITG